MKRMLMMLLAIGLVAGCATTGGSASGGSSDGITIPKPKGNLRYSISVSKFKNKAGWRGQWDLGDAFTEMTTDALVSSGWFVVLAASEMRKEALAEQDFAASGRAAGGKKAAKIGRVTPAQILLAGAVTHVERSAGGTGGALRFKGVSVGGSKGKAEINLTLYLVDSETGQVKASTKVVGTSKKRGFKLGYYGSKLGGLTGNLATFKKDNMGKAAEHAVAQAVSFLIKQLDKMPWEGTIIRAGSKIMMNRGTREGVAVGAKFNVGTADEIVDPDTGEVLDVEIATAGTIEVTKVKEKIAYCKALEGGGKIKKGMTVHPVD